MSGPMTPACASANTRASLQYTAMASAGPRAMALSLHSSTSSWRAASPIQSASLTGSAAFCAVPLVHRGELPPPGSQGTRYHDGAEASIEEEPQIAEVCGSHRHCAQAASGAISCGSSR